MTTKADQGATDAEREDLLGTIRYALRYSLEGKPLPKGMRWPDPEIAAERVLEHIERSCWRVERGHPTPAHTAGGAGGDQPPE
jgi:hypothetical protein